MNLSIKLSAGLLLMLNLCMSASGQVLKLNDKGYLETRGVNVMVYSNPFSAVFYDEKRSGIDIVHHGVLTVTNGGVRLNETPEQWDLVPEMQSRNVNEKTGEFDVRLYYKEYDFASQIKVTPKDKGFLICVYLDKPLPESTVGKACFNLEFLPSAYWNHSYIADGKPLYFPRYAGYDTGLRPLADKALQVNNLITSDLRGRDEFTVVKPLVEANRLVFAPDEPTRMVTVTSETPLQLYDGRIVAQNGWFVVHSFLPAGKTGKVLEWYVEPNSVKDWVREPVIGFSQVGYTPDRAKETVIESDPNDVPGSVVNVWKVAEDGSETLIKAASVTKWGKYLRYDYLKADFSDVKEPGIYYLEYKGQKTNIFPIREDIYKTVWYPTSDVWFPEQMDHMTVREGYRLWHNAPHLDDALQAPINTPHFDNFEQGSELHSPYQPGEYIEGFDKGGWFDAGDFDIESGSHASTIMSFVNLWDEFHPDRDETMIDEENKFVNIHFADGKPDLLQQIEHGVYPLLNMIEKIGHGCRGINHATLYQYNRLDEPSTITDNKLGTGDERWLFTYSNPNLEYQFCSALAATSRVLKDFNPELSARCLAAALKVWNDNSSNQMYRGMSYTAAFQLYLATGDKNYVKGMEESLLESLKPRSGMPAMFSRMRLGGVGSALQAAPYMSKDFVEKLRPYAIEYKETLDELFKNNPYGVMSVYGDGWGSTGMVVSQGINAYYVHKYFPDIVTKDDVYRCADFIFGNHPFSNLSFVTGVGVSPKKVNYGNNRADFSFIAGALVPGLLLLQPDYIECKDDWPFFWGQNEATIGGNSQYMLFGAILANLK